MVIWLVVLTILKKIKSMGRIIPYIMGNKTCLKPPTSDVKQQNLAFYLQPWDQRGVHPKKT
jgi:hypothetical protein